MSEKKPNPKDALFRLAFRQELGFVNAYYALPDTMDGALLLGSMRETLLEAEPALFQRFRELVQDAVNVMLKDAGLGPASEWHTFRAPDHERTGEA